MRRLYFDHNATSPLRASLRARLSELVEQDFSNPGSIHQQGQAARTLVEQARGRIVRSIDGIAGTLTFTSGATESNNMVLNSLGEGDVLLTSPLEHPSIRDTAKAFEARGVEIRWLAHDDCGRLVLDTLSAALEGVTLVAVMAANNELGNINDIARIAAACKEAEVPLHVDAAQVWGRWPFSVVPGICSVTLSSHKAGGPVGIGALWADDRYRYPALMLGGEQERGRRAGTENVLWIDLMSRLSDAAYTGWTSIEALRDNLATAFVALGGVRNGDPENAMGNTLNISFPGYDAEELVMALDLEGISMSTGSACTAGSVDISEVIAALNIGDARAESALRWSLGPDATEEGITRAAETMERVLARIPAK